MRCLPSVHTLQNNPFLQAVRTGAHVGRAQSGPFGLSADEKCVASLHMVALTNTQRTGSACLGRQRSRGGAQHTGSAHVLATLRLGRQGRQGGRHEVQVDAAHDNAARGYLAWLYREDSQQPASDRHLHRREPRCLSSALLLRRRPALFNHRRSDVPRWLQD